MITVALSLGSNVGDRKKNIDSMIGELKTVLQPPVEISRLMETEPLGTTGTHEWYFNCVMIGRYPGHAHELMHACQHIEKKLGRKTKNDLSPRTADIDILLADQRIISESDLNIPHPALLNRRFCIEGIASLRPDWIHPVSGLSFHKLSLKSDKQLLSQKIIFH